MEKYFSAAPWDILLKLITGGLCIFGIVLIFFSPGFWTIAVMGGLIVGSFFFTVRGYKLEGKTLKIQRVGWTKDFNLRNLKDVGIDNHAMQRSWRLMGNGGLFGWIGTFRNSRLGTYRAYVTNRYRCVVLDLENRVLVLSPDKPEAFIAAVQTIQCSYS